MSSQAQESSGNNKQQQEKQQRNFIEKAQNDGIGALLGQFTHKVRLTAFRTGFAAYKAFSRVSVSLFPPISFFVLMWGGVLFLSFLSNRDLSYVGQGGFDSCIAGLKIDKVEPGTVKCSIKVAPNLQNSYGTLHGGAIAVMVDVVGTLALMSKDASRPGVSVDIGVSYMAAAKEGDVVDVEGKVLRMGQKLGFTQIDFRRRSDGAHLATGTHTKAL